jgi:phospholipase C
MKYVVLCASLLTVSACGNTSGNTTVSCQTLATTHAIRPAGWGGTVFTIVLENHSRGDILGNDDAPYINQLANGGAVAAGYHDNYVHPSESNYLWMVAGENFGILDDNDPGPGNHIGSTAHLADQIEAAGLEWKTYQQSMGEPCGLASSGTYAAKHNPFVFFDDINGWDGTTMHKTDRCIAHVVDYGALEDDLTNDTVPSYVFITPDLQHDMHDGSVAESDAWLQQEVPKIFASPAFQRGGVLFLTWDEGGGFPANDDPPFIAISANAKAGYVSKVDYDTSAFLKTVETLLGLEALPCNPDPAAVGIMADLFSVPMK